MLNLPFPLKDLGKNLGAPREELEGGRKIRILMESPQIFEKIQCGVGTILTGPDES